MVNPYVQKIGDLNLWYDSFSFAVKYVLYKIHCLNHFDVRFSSIQYTDNVCCHYRHLSPECFPFSFWHRSSILVNSSSDISGSIQYLSFCNGVSLSLVALISQYMPTYHLEFIKPPSSSFMYKFLLFTKSVAYVYFTLLRSY